MGSYFDALAEEYDRKIAHLSNGATSYLVIHTVDEIIRSTEARRGARLLEVGCGTGIYLQEFARRGFDVRGFDISERMLDVASKRVGMSRLVQGDVQDMPFGASSFDLTIALDVFQYVRDPDRAIAEMKRVTRWAGYVVVLVPNYASPMRMVARSLRQGGYRYDAPELYNPFYYTDVRHLLARHFGEFEIKFVRNLPSFAPALLWKIMKKSRTLDGLMTNRFISLSIIAIGRL